MPGRACRYPLVSPHPLEDPLEDPLEAPRRAASRVDGAIGDGVGLAWQLGGLPRPAHPSSWRRDPAAGLEKTRGNATVGPSGPSSVAGSHPHMPALRLGHCSEPTVTTKTRGGTTIYQRKPDTRSRRADHAHGTECSLSLWRADTRELEVWFSTSAHVERRPGPP